MSQADPGLAGPPDDLSAFPAASINSGTTLYRSVTKPKGPWWFSSQLTQRFDLPKPRGTCYLAADIETALREKGRAELLSGKVLNTEFLAGVEVHQLRLPSDVRAANLLAPAAVTFGASRELAATFDYDLTCTWAAAFDRSGYDGIVYGSRFTSGPHWNALALFGPAGDAKWESDGAMSARAAAAQAGMAVEPVPRRLELSMERPPTRKRTGRTSAP